MKVIVGKAPGIVLLTAFVSGQVHGQVGAGLNEATTATAPAGKRLEKNVDRRPGYLVRTAISKDNGLGVSPVTVRAHDGAVTLEGSVPDGSQIDPTGATAPSVTGVTLVNSRHSIPLLP
ncbi:BON domain-containing protein [Paraburkholderia megapolitana]|uniref:BON domain-containing protein n=1 Tax=Paraburkholderia megapolitana TaxID=420953 RepID=A0A1I3W8H9_9BURK|nr:BON domain-containing protein [Paraburkholderia megapolitana]QDQ82235.1 BON domain-containing protein [Paraburkholderia megapolitana]SFK03964.1 BON domain-containing protein [Paraburkholderia megapolitana]